MTTARPAEAIELRVETIAQLFHTLDPFPFRERDLDREAEEYIVSWARELAVDQPINILVHIPDSEAQTKPAARAWRSFHQIFRLPRRSSPARPQRAFSRWPLARGRRYYSAHMPRFGAYGKRLSGSVSLPAPGGRILILGSVANWRPLEIFLYAGGRLRVGVTCNHRLSEAAVETKPYLNGQSQVPMASPA